jgi:hypothetical protein
MLWFVAGLAGLVAGIAAVRFLVQPPSGLRLTVFRPWRGDPWPRGIQEDDDARFDWSGPKRRRAAIRLGWEDAAVWPATVDVPTDADPVEIAVEDLPDGTVRLEPLDPGQVHRPSH